MKQERVAIVCNGAIPDSNLPSGAQGLRARGLQIGLDSLGFDVDIVTMANAVHSQIARWNASKVRNPGYWRLLPSQNIVDVLNQSYGTVIIPNWPALPYFRPNDGTRLIYDFFSATQVEHSFITDEKTLEQRRETKVELLRHATAFIGNGVGRAEYGAHFLASNGLSGRDVTSVRLTTQGQARSVDKYGKFRVFAGGFDQPWTQGVTPQVLNQVANITDAEIITIGLGRNSNLEDNTTVIAELAKKQHQAGRVLGYPPTQALEYNRLNASSHVALDVFKNNSERTVSYSTRAVNSLSNGCPLITMSFTEIGQIVKDLECGWVMEDFSVDALTQLLREIDNDREEIERRAKNTELFQKMYGDPIVEAKKLVELLT